MRAFRAILRRLLLRWSRPVVVVSGLPRSGTSMAMRMLVEGGLEPFMDDVREADEDNPRGYFEFDRVKRLHEETDRSWLREARGSAIKVISHLLMELPNENRYQVIFLRRDLDEVIASQNKMLRRRGEALAPDDARVKASFERHLEKTRDWLSTGPNIEVLELDYALVVASPQSAAEQIRSFLGLELDVARMANAVDATLYRNRSGTGDQT